MVHVNMEHRIFSLEIIPKKWKADRDILSDAYIEENCVGRLLLRLTLPLCMGHDEAREV